MKRTPLIALALAALTAAPVQAQEQTVTDSYDQGDWWGLDVTGEGVGSGDTVILVNGEAVRTGDRAELQAFLIYREPKPSGVTGSRSSVIIDCAARTQSAAKRSNFYAALRMRELSTAASAPTAIEPASALYRFACTGSRRYATHFGQGSRTRIAAGAFSRYHH